MTIQIMLRHSWRFQSELQAEIMGSACNDQARSLLRTVLRGLQSDGVARGCALCVGTRSDWLL